MISIQEKYEVLNNSNVGFEFEFYSNHNIEETATLLSRALNRKIRIEYKAHSDFQPDQSTFKLEPDNSGGKNLVELVTGALPFRDAKLLMHRVLRWVNENGYTNERSSIHLNISFSEKKYGRNFLTKINPLKFILEFDEDLVYKTFPERAGVVYAKSIKYVLPQAKYHFASFENINPHHFIFPKEKYYGVNFEKLAKNYLEFRYLGGKDWEKKGSDIDTLLEHFIISLYKCARNPGFTYENNIELKKILEYHKKVIEAYDSYDNFKKNYPKIGFLVDLNSDDQIIKLYWGKIRERLYKILGEGNLHDGIINYNSDTGRIQIKDADLMKAYKLEYLDLFNCKVRGYIEKCDIFECEIDNADMVEVNLFNTSEAKFSKLKDSYVNNSCVLDNCYFYGKNGMMNGTMNDGIFREGKITHYSTLNNVDVIEHEKIRTTRRNGY